MQAIGEGVSDIEFIEFVVYQEWLLGEEVSGWQGCQTFRWSIWVGGSGRFTRREVQKIGQGQGGNVFCVEFVVFIVLMGSVNKNVYKEIGDIRLKF